MKTLPEECKATVPLSVSSAWSVQMERGWLLPLPSPVCVRVLSVSLQAGIPQHCPTPNVGFPCAESVSLPTQHMTRWS